MNSISQFAKRAAILTGLACGAFALAVVADWSAPLDTPPTCTAGNSGCDAPLNVGYAPQTKHGALWVEGFASQGVASSIGMIVENGVVGIGTISPDTTTNLDVEGKPIKAGGGLILPVLASDPVSPVAGQIWMVQ